MNDIKTSIVNSVLTYTEKLQYLAHENPLLVRDLMLLIVVEDIYEWSSWANKSQEDQLFLQNFRKEIVRKNVDIENYHTQTNEFYKNVSIPQTSYTWKRLYDSPDVVSFDTLETITYPYYYYGVSCSTTKPVRNQELINSGVMVRKPSNGTITIPFNSHHDDFLWFAIPTISGDKSKWFISDINNSDIGGQFNLFDGGSTLNIDIPNTFLKNKAYKIYVSNYSTEISTIKILK